MAHIIDMPKLSDTMTVGTLVKWKKKEGEVVKSGDMLAEVETDKATMELESFFDGTLLKIYAQEGSQVAIGAALCVIGKPGEAVPDAPAPATAKGSAGAPAGTSAQTTSKQSEQAAPPQAQSTQQAAATPQSQTAGTIDKLGTASMAAGSNLETTSTGERLRISPLAKRLAIEKGIDPRGIIGTGPGKRIVRADILAAEKNPPQSKGGLALAVSGTKGGSSDKGPIQEERTVAVSNMRGTIARRLLESKTTIPHFYLEIEIDAEPLLALRQQLNAALDKQGVKLSVNDFILKGSAEALRQVPAVNASWENTQIRFFSAAHVSFAVAIDDGLITPVVRDAHLKSVFAISTEAKQLAKLAKDKKLQPAQFTGGTFCVSNLGMMGIDRFSAIINPPNSAILAVGATVKKPVVKGDSIVIGQRMSLTLSCDHRVVDGALGAQYLAALKQLLEAPALLLI